MNKHTFLFSLDVFVLWGQYELLKLTMYFSIFLYVHPDRSP